MHPKTEAHAADEPLLPIAFTPFEYYYYLDDGPTYPTTFPIELRFSGMLDEQRFRRALAKAIGRHPLLDARVEMQGRFPRWIPANSSEPFVDWMDADVPLDYPAGGVLDLRKQPGLRTWVRAGAQSARVVFEFHHACCDGLAGLQFVQDVLALYRAGDAECGEGALRALEPERLRHRGEIGADEPRKVSAFKDAWYTFKVWATILFRTPLVLASAPRTADSPKREPLGFDVATLSAVETSKLRAAAKQAGTTTNDMLLRDLLLVLRTWNQQFGHRNKGRLRINVPVNVRVRADAGLPVANRIGYGFVTATMDDASDSGTLLAVVRDEVKRMKDWKLALYFLGGVAVGSSLPGVLPWAMRRRRSFATAVLSNVGRFVADPTNRDRNAVWACGELTLDWIGGVPPVRPLTRAAAIVIDYAGCTSICLRTDPHYFDAAASRQLLERFVSRVRETLATVDQA